MDCIYIALLESLQTLKALLLLQVSIYSFTNIHTEAATREVHPNVPPRLLDSSLLDHLSRESINTSHDKGHPNCSRGEEGGSYQRRQGGGNTCAKTRGREASEGREEAKSCFGMNLRCHLRRGDLHIHTQHCPRTLKHADCRGQGSNHQLSNWRQNSLTPQQHATNN